MKYKTLLPWAALFGLCGAAYIVSTPPEETKQERKKAEIVEIDDSTERLPDNAVIRFYQPGCPICAKVKKEFETAAETYAQKIQFLQSNFVKNPKLADRFNVNYHPTIIFLKNGKQVEQANGATAAQELEEIIKMHYLTP